MGRDRLAWPEWACLTGGVIADRKNEVKNRRPRRHEFIPTLAAIAGRLHVQPLQGGECERMHCALRMAACGICAKAAFTQFVQETFSQDGSGGVARADEQHVVRSSRSHGAPSQLQQEWEFGAQQTGVSADVVAGAASWNTGMLPSVWKCSQAIPCGSVTQCFSLRA